MKEETLDERGVRNAIVNLLHNEGINLKRNNGVNMCSISTEMFIPFACLPIKINPFLVITGLSSGRTAVITATQLRLLLSHFVRFTPSA